MEESNNNEEEDTNVFDWQKEFPEVFAQGGFDVIIGNPPYIKEYENARAFDGFREKSPYYKGKMDVCHGFVCIGIDLLKEGGFLGFITQNNWTTNEGASIMRKKIIEDTKVLQFIDFHTFKVFENAEIQTMTMLLHKNKEEDNYMFDYRKLEGKKLTLADVKNAFAKIETQNTKYLTAKISRQECKGKTLTFSENDSLLEKIAKDKLYLREDEATNGIHTHHDCVSKSINYKFPDLEIGKGIFVLSQKEKKELSLSKKESKLLKPFFTSDEIYRYYTNPKNNSWIIYTDSSFKNSDSMNDYPKLKSHLDFVGKAITSDNKPYGLHRAREEHFFKGEKIVSLRKCVGQPCFSYNDFDCYVSAMYYVIQTNRWDMKFLTGVLNSKLVMFWLRNKGKMQGENFQVDKAPLMQIPLPQANAKQQQKIAKLVDKILAAKASGENTAVFEEEIDRKVYELYGLTAEEIAIIHNS